MDLHNLDVLHAMAGPMITIEAIDDNDTVGISCPAPQKLQLKKAQKSCYTATQVKIKRMARLELFCDRRRKVLKLKSLGTQYYCAR